MNRCVAVVAVLCASWGVTSDAAAQTRCTRGDLQSAVNGYLAAQAKGNPAGMRLAPTVKYAENMQDAAIGKGIIHSPLKIDFHRSLLDTEACETFTEVIVTNPAHPYVLGIRLKLAGKNISELDVMVTDKDDWLFNADVYLKYSSSEDWGAIAEGARDTRATLIAAANAYEDRFGDPNVVVPWSAPCNRLEGGIHSGKGTAEDSCNGGFPGANFPITMRRFVVDPDIGAIVALSRFSVNELPDSHLFRLEKGKIRFVHTLTVCTIPDCGFKVPARQ